jgi:hypothetical protein
MSVERALRDAAKEIALKHAHWRSAFDTDLESGAPPRTPFDAYVWFASQYNQEAVEDAREAARAEQGRGWFTDLWSFTRLIKGHPSMTGKSAIEAADSVQQIFLELDPYETDPWARWLQSDSGDPRMEFVHTWGKIKYKPGYSPLNAAIEQEDQEPWNPPPQYEVPTEKYRRFLGIARQLQIIMGDRNIFLPCEKVAAAMGVDPMTISRYRRWAIKDRLLIVQREHKFRGKGAGEATEFRFAETLLQEGKR